MSKTIQQKSITFNQVLNKHVELEEAIQAHKSLIKKVFEGLPFDCVSNPLTGEFYINFSQDDLFTSYAERARRDITESDCPVSQSTGKRFCEFMQFDKRDTALVLSACCTDDQYDAWLRDEQIANILG